MKRSKIVISILLILTMLLIVSVHQKNKRVDRIGQMLANWSSTHQTTMRINGKPISLTGGPIFEMVLEQTSNGSMKYCRGYTPVLWQTVEATAEDNRTVRANLIGRARKISSRVAGCSGGSPP